MTDTVITINIVFDTVSAVSAALSILTRGGGLLASPSGSSEVSGRKGGSGERRKEAKEEGG